MKRILLVVSTLGLIALTYYFFSNHYYYLFVDAPQTIADAELTKADLNTLQNHLDYRNQVKDFPVYPNEHTPFIVGAYNDSDIEERYWCSDGCPYNGILYLNFSSSTEETCEGLSGNKLYKWGWGSEYVGCSPTENNFSDNSR